MKKYLPVFFLFCFIFIIQLFLVKGSALAQTSTPTPTTAVQTPAEGDWVPDAEVNFFGKLAARSDDFLNLILQNYNYKWISIGDNKSNPLIPFWSTVRNIIYALILLAVLVAAFLLIITRNRNLKLKRFIPRFIFVILLITFSFSFIQLLYQVTDIIQEFFLRKPNNEFISSKDLLHLSFNYEEFIGFRRYGIKFDESAFISLLLVKLTAITYFAMTILLIIRKIILWFFIAVSPIFPILILFPLLRNTAKIWVGEFFRWLLYAPLFALFLSQLVSLWKNVGVPIFLPGLPSQAACEGGVEHYPTAINILLGGPGQCVSMTNNVNLPSTFALYAAALVMLWIVTILPFVLLRIFLDYLYAFKFNDNPLVKNIINNPILTKYGITGTPPIQPVPPPDNIGPAGIARPIPFTQKVTRPFEMPKTPEKPFTTGMAKEIPRTETIQRPILQPTYTEILRTTNIAVPTMRDIARFETSSITKEYKVHEEIAKAHEILERIANPNIITVPVERERFTTLREKLIQEKEKGNPLASSILSAVNTLSYTTLTPREVAKQEDTIRINEVLKNIANPEKVTVTEEKEKYIQLREQLIQEKEKGNPLANTIIESINAVSQKEYDLTTAETLKEELVTEEQKGNPLAVTILSQARNVSEETVATEINKQEQIIRMDEVVNNIVNISSNLTVEEKQQYNAIREQLLQEKQNGNPLANTILSIVNNIAQNNYEAVDFGKFREQLSQEKQKNNPLANSILTAADNIPQTTIMAKLSEKEDTIRINEVLKNIANPEKVTVPAKKEEYVKVKEQLIQEGQKGNSLATTILNIVNNISKTKVVSSVNQKQENIKVNQVLKNIANPEVITNSSDRQKYVEFKEKLTQEKGKGNPLATTILQAINTVSQKEYDLSTSEKTKERLIEEKQNGNPLAATILTMVQNLPKVENIKEIIETDQTVSIEETLKNIANPEVITNTTKRQQYTELKEKLIQEENSGNPLAFSILSAANIVSEKGTDLVTSERIKEQLLQEKENPLATSIFSASNISSEEISTTINTEKIKEQLSQEKQKNNPLANSILTAADNIPQTTIMAKLSEKEDTIRINEVLKNIANPEKVTVTEEKEKYTQLKEHLTQEKEKENPLATTLVNAANIISKNENNLSVTEILKGELMMEKQNPLSTTILNIAQNIPSSVVVNEMDKQGQMTRIEEVVNNIINLSPTLTTEQKQQYDSLRQQIVQEGQKGNPLATYILSTINGGPVVSATKIDAQGVKEQVIAEKEKGNPLASIIIDVFGKHRMERKTFPESVMPAQFPVINRIQEVNLDDYEAVKRMWRENYKKLEPPKGIDGKQKNRKDWIKGDVNKIMQIINLLTSTDDRRVRQGMAMVGNILPFLLIGGFSQTEVIAYLKAKQEAGKDTLEGISEKEEEEETQVSVEKKKQETPKTMTMEEAIVEPEEKEEKPNEAPKEVNKNEDKKNNI